MERIVVEVSPAVGLKKELHVIDRGSITIGRGYNNDIIIADPYISPTHVHIRVNPEGGFFVADAGTRNGTFLVSEGHHLHGRKRLGEETAATSGQAVNIGNTVLRIYAADHPVHAARSLHASRVDMLQLSRPMTMLYALVGVFLVYFIQAVVTTHESQITPGKIFFVELLSLLGIMIWPGFWALLGRVIRHRPRFQVHLTLTLIYLFIMLPISNLAAFLGYVFMSVWIEYIVVMLLSGAVFALLFFGNLTYATHLGSRSRVITSAAIPLVFILFLTVGMFVFRDRFNPEPPYYARLKPPYFRPVKVYTLDESMDKVSKVFTEAREQKRTD